MAVKFAERRTVEQVEEGVELAPKFGPDGFMPCVTTDADSGDVLMLGYMNAQALQLTI
ncbi:MAG: phosphoribosyl-AMP cyclohydrolase, partial [Pseudomonadota bacterium]